MSKKNKILIDKNSGKSMNRIKAEFAQSAIATNSQTVRAFAFPSAGLVDITESLAIMSEKVQAVNDGDLKGAEEMLTTQATALNVIFNELARRASVNMGHLQATDTYLRLALKAQTQCRATLETLAEIKYPRHATFVRQANISNGHQQVNNYGREEIPTTKLSRNENVTRIQSKAIRTNTHLEAVGEVHRGED